MDWTVRYSLVWRVAYLGKQAANERFGDYLRQSLPCSFWTYSSPPSCGMTIGRPSATHWDSINYAHEIDSDSGFFAINSSSLTITVTDVNEPPVITGPTTISFPENGTGVVASYSAEDPEGVRYYLGHVGG